MPFKKMYDALTKWPIITEAFTKTDEMHKLAREHFVQAFECVYTSDSGSCSIALKEEDKKINNLEKEIRKQVYEYLAVSSAPNVNASLILANTVIDYERIGDLCKNIANLHNLFPAKLEHDEYDATIATMREKLLSIFDLTRASLQEADSKKAREAIRLHDEVKELHAKMIKMLNEDQSLTPLRGMFYALLCYYLRRVNGHLSNISSTALTTFPTMGFFGGELDDE